MTSPHAVTHLRLHQFRNHRELDLHVAPAPVVITGRNGAGKTNILEALSLLSPGRGLRGATLRDMDCQHSESAAWVVACEVLTHGEKTSIGMGRDPESVVEKRVLKIHGEKQRSQRALTQHVAIQWVTPAMDLVFVEGGTPRRKLLDRITYSFSPEHAERVAAYEQAMRERNKILARYGAADPYWLSVLEQQMAEHAIAITLARLTTLEHIRAQLLQGVAGFPGAHLSLTGEVESLLAQGGSALDVEARVAERYSEHRRADAAAGRALLGAHKSQFTLIHSINGREAAQCSTGEQKALLLALILAAARAREAWCGCPPILLLDEVIAHLDVDKKTGLFDLILAAGVQAWMTGTEAKDFQGLANNATHVKIDGGTVCV